MKNRLKKWIWAVCIVAAVSVLGSIPAYAAEIKEVNIEGYELIENGMRIYLNADEGILLDKDNLEIVLGDASYAIDKMTSFEDMNEGVSYLVLVDVSGSVTKKDIANAKEILTHLVEVKADEDNISIMEIRNEIEKTDFVSDKDTALEQVQAIERTGEDTNLYLAIRDALNILSEDKTCHQKKCLIIISDGMDCQKNGILFEDVRDAIKGANIPICTLAMPWNGSTASEEDGPDKFMKSFTENAAGGVHVRYEDAGLDNVSIAELFSGFSHGGTVAEISLTGFVPNGSNMTLSVDVQLNEEMVQGDSCQIPSHVISAVVKQEVLEEPVEEAEVVEENAAVKEESEQGGESWMYLLILILGVAVVTAVGIVVYSKKKNATAAVEENSADMPKTAGENEPDKEEQKKDADQFNAAKSALYVDFDAENPTVDGVMDKAAEVKPTVVTLTEIGPEATRVLKAEIRNTLTIGRRKSAGLVIADDNQVSGMHCELRMNEDKMYVKDLDSTNGTFLNGIPVMTLVEVKQEDTLYIGAFEYRVSWE